MNRSTTYPLILIIGLALGGCTGMKHITSADPLFIGSEVSFTQKDGANRQLTHIANEVVKPKPNRRLLWMRPGVARYNMLSDSARTRKFWKNEIAPPVLLSGTKPEQVAATIRDRMFHSGYFINTVDADTTMSSKRKARLTYRITLGEPYTLASIAFPHPVNDLTRQIDATRDESLLQPGDIYTLESVKQERIRIDRDLKENGYLYFSPDFLMLKADSVTGTHQVRAELIVKPETPVEARKAYAIRNVYIHDDHVLDSIAADTLQKDHHYLISEHHNLKFEAIRQGLFLKPGDRYARSNYMHTLRYFNALPIIRNANVKFLPVAGTDELDIALYMTQRKRFAYTAEFNTVFRSTNYFGPGIIFSYTDRNARRGAEVLKINLRGSFEIQIAAGDINPAYEVGIEVSYLMPRFFPNFLLNSARKSLPKTSLSAGYHLFNRLDLYKLNSVFTNFGYRWSKTDRISHALNPIEVVFTRLPEDSKSDEFNDYLEENPGVRRSFDEQFILGSSYDFTYEPQAGSRNQFFFRGGFDLSGNLLDALYTISDAPVDSMGRHTLLGVAYSQYIRPRIDLRYKINLGQRSHVVTRFSTGVGIPLGNSDILPYVKQFYVGGTNSLRSFIARSVGPGSEVPPEGYNDLTGDIRVEGNVEYRFDLAGSLKGVLFMDAGNIWLFNEDPSRPNAQFRFDSFLQEVAISTGWGLRWDFDFIVARLDFAYTLRTPYLPEGDRWTSNVNLLKPTWNIAIGYPF